MQCISIWTFRNVYDSAVLLHTQFYFLGVYVQTQKHWRSQCQQVSNFFVRVENEAAGGFPDVNLSNALTIWNNKNTQKFDFWIEMKLYWP